MSATILCHEGKTFAPTEPHAISDRLADQTAMIWVDVTDPKPDDMALLREEFGFHPLAIEDAMNEHQRPKIEAYDGYYFLVFYRATYLREQNHIEIDPLHMFIGRNFLVTVHHGAFPQIEQTQARWKAAGSPLGSDVGALVYALLDAIVDDYFPIMDELADRVDELEDAIFTNFNEAAIQNIFTLKRDLLHLRRVAGPQRDVLNVLLRRDMPIFRQESIIYLQDVYDHIVRVTDSVDTYRDLLSSALDSYLSLQSNRLNQIVKVLTITSIVLMADALIAGIYGMNFAYMPELSWQYGYPLALGLMVCVSLGLVFFFKRMRWI